MSEPIAEAYVRIRVDDSGFHAELRSKIEEASGDATVKVKAETAEADVEIHKIRGELDVLAHTTARAKVKVDVDKGPLDELVKLQGKAWQGFGTLTTAALGLGPALVPIGAVVAGVGASMGAAFLAAGAGLAGYGLLAKSTVTQASTNAAKLSTLTTNLINAQENGTRAAQRSAQRALSNFTDNLTAAQLTAAQSINHFKSLLLDAETSIAPTVQRTISGVLGILSHALPTMLPLFRAAGDAVNGLLREVDKAVQGPGFRSFIALLTRETGPAILAFGHTIGNLAIGFGDLLTAFTPMSHGILSGLVDLSARFREWASTVGASSGFAHFIDYIKTQGPIVGQTLVHIGSSLVGIIKGLAPLGGSTLGTLNTFLGALDHVISVAPGLAPALVQFALWGSIAARIAGPILNAAKAIEVFGFASGIASKAGPIAGVKALITRAAPGLVATAGTGVVGSGIAAEGAPAAAAFTAAFSPVLVAGLVAAAGVAAIKVVDTIQRNAKVAKLDTPKGTDFPALEKESSAIKKITDAYDKASLSEKHWAGWSHIGNEQRVSDYQRAVQGALAMGDKIAGAYRHMGDATATATLRSKDWTTAQKYDQAVGLAGVKITDAQEGAIIKATLADKYRTGVLVAAHAPTAALSAANSKLAIDTLTAASKAGIHGQALANLADRMGYARVSSAHLTNAQIDAGNSMVAAAAKAGLNRGQIEALGSAMGLSKGQTDSLITALHNVPPSTSARVSAPGAVQAYGEVSSLAQALANLHNHVINIQTKFTTVGTPPALGGVAPGAGGQHAFASGGEVRGFATGGSFDGSGLPGFAMGGDILEGLVRGPGTGTSDSIRVLNARLSNGEFIEPKRITDLYRPLFEGLRQGESLGRAESHLAAGLTRGGDSPAIATAAQAVQAVTAAPAARGGNQYHAHATVVATSSAQVQAELQTAFRRMELGTAEGATRRCEEHPRAGWVHRCHARTIAHAPGARPV